MSRFLSNNNTLSFYHDFILGTSQISIVKIRDIRSELVTFFLKCLAPYMFPFLCSQCYVDYRVAMRCIWDESRMHQLVKVRLFFYVRNIR